MFELAEVRKDKMEETFEEREGVLSGPTLRRDSALLSPWLLVCLKLGHIEFLVDHFWHGLDLRAQLLLDAVEVEPVLVGDEINGQSEVAEPARSSDSVQVCLGRLWEVEVDDHVHGLDVYASCEQV